MFRWLRGNTRIVQIAKASSQSGSGGIWKVKKLFQVPFLPVQHEALIWDCPRTCLAVWPPWLCWLVAWSLDFEPPGVSRRWRWWDSLGPIVAQTELGWWQCGWSAFAAWCGRGRVLRGLSHWFLEALCIFEKWEIFFKFFFQKPKTEETYFHCGFRWGRTHCCEQLSCGACTASQLCCHEKSFWFLSCYKLVFLFSF